MLGLLMLGTGVRSCRQVGTRPCALNMLSTRGNNYMEAEGSFFVGGGGVYRYCDDRMFF